MVATQEALTVEQLERLPWGSVGLRCLQEEYPRYPSKLFPDWELATTIHLLHAEADIDGNQFFLHGVYSSKEPRDSYSGEVGVEVKFLGHNAQEREPKLRKILEEWSVSPPWLKPDQAVACRRVDGQIQEVRFRSVRLMGHYARLASRLAHMVVSQRKGSLLCGAYYCLERFIEQQNKVWEEIEVTLSKYADLAR